MIVVADEAFLLPENLMRLYLYRRRFTITYWNNDGTIMKGAVHPLVTFLHGVVLNYARGQI